MFVLLAKVWAVGYLLVVLVVSLGVLAVGVPSSRKPLRKLK